MVYATQPTNGVVTVSFKMDITTVGSHNGLLVTTGIQNGNNVQLKQFGIGKSGIMDPITQSVGFIPKAIEDYRPESTDIRCEKEDFSSAIASRDDYVESICATPIGANTGIATQQTSLFPAESFPKEMDFKLNTFENKSGNEYVLNDTTTTTTTVEVFRAPQDNSTDFYKLPPGPADQSGHAHLIPTSGPPYEIFKNMETKFNAKCAITPAKTVQWNEKPEVFETHLDGHESSAIDTVLRRQFTENRTETITSSRDLQPIGGASSNSFSPYFVTSPATIVTSPTSSQTMLTSAPTSPTSISTPPSSRQSRASPTGPPLDVNDPETSFNTEYNRRIGTPEEGRLSRRDDFLRDGYEKPRHFPARVLGEYQHRRTHSNEESPKKYTTTHFYQRSQLQSNKSFNAGAAQSPSPGRQPRGLRRTQRAPGTSLSPTNYGRSRLVYSPDYERPSPYMAGDGTLRRGLSQDQVYLREIDRQLSRSPSPWRPVTPDGRTTDDQEPFHLYETRDCLGRIINKL